MYLLPPPSAGGVRRRDSAALGVKKESSFWTAFAAAPPVLALALPMPLRGPVPAPLRAPKDVGEVAHPVSARGSARGSTLVRSTSATFKRKTSKKQGGSLSDSPSAPSRWFKRWKSKKKLQVPPAIAAQLSAQLMMSRRFDELSETIHASSAAAADTAHSMGLSEDVCLQFYNGVVEAAARALDPGSKDANDGGSGGEGGEASGPSPAPAESVPEASSPNTKGAARIEGILARAIKRSAIRLTDLFTEWDVDRNGSISKKELKAALLQSGIKAQPGELDRLFNLWDRDKSGGIDYTELNRALKPSGAPSLQRQLSEAAEHEAEAVVLLGRGHALAVKQMKESKEAAKQRRLALSPRSLALREEAEQKQAERAQELAKLWQEDEESGRRWTASKWLASRNVAAVVADALKLPALSHDAASQFSYVKNLKRPQVEELLSSAGLQGLVDFVAGAVESLSMQSTGSAEVLNDKFATTAKFQMTYGSLSLFFGGLESLLGPPKMYKGPNHAERSLFNMMEYEHTGDKDATSSFTAPNGTTTTSEVEWQFVCCPEARNAYPERQGFREHHSQWCRSPKPLAELMDLMESYANERLRAGGHSEMILEELVGGRLYTGPMVR